MRHLGWSFAVMVALWPLMAAADAPGRYRLELVRAPAARTCAEQPELQRAVAERLGRDPFGADGDNVIVATVDRQDDAFVARLFLRDVSGDERGVRELPPQAECSEVTAAMALAISIAVDPMAFAVKAPAPPHVPIAVGLGAGARMGSGMAPGLGPQFAIGAGLRRLGLGGMVEARLAPGRGQTYGEGDVRVSSIGAAALPCWWSGRAELCGVGVVSRVTGRGRGYDQDDAAPLLALAGGARAGVRIHTRAPEVTVHLEVLRTLSNVSFLVDDVAAWRSNPWLASVGLDVWGWR